MAGLQPKFSVDQSLLSGDVIRITDTTGGYDASNPGGYGTPNISLSGVTATRFVFGDYIRESNIAKSVTSLASFNEYKLSSNTGIYDAAETKAVVKDDLFIPQVTESITAGSGSNAADETGRVYAMVGFVPNDTFYDFSPADLQFTEDKFPDRVYNLTYEVYGTTVTSGNIADGGQYIVIGADQTKIITYNGSHYRAGEIFFGVTGVTTFTATSSTTVSVLQGSTVQEHFLLSYYSNFYVQDLTARASAKHCRCEEKFIMQVMKLRMELEGMLVKVSENALNISGTTKSIEFIAEEYNRIINCNCG